MTTWRAARSLTVLRHQVDQLWPGRRRSSDGIIGDAEHRQDPTSDHNPDAAGVVHAIDITHDPAHGADMAWLAAILRLHRDPRIKYVIWSRRIFSATNTPWSWRPYTGSDPHTGHLHLSVVADARADDIRPWTLEDSAMQLTGPDPWGDPNNPNGQAAELRNAHAAIMNGYQDDAAGAAGVIARLERIEVATRALLDHPAPTIDYRALAAALLDQLAAELWDVAGRGGSGGS